MEKKDAIRKFINCYIDNNSDNKIESITRYIGVNKDKVKHDRDIIIDFFRANFLIYGMAITYEDLRHDTNNNSWIDLNNKKDLELFENIVAVGYEAGIFENDMVYRYQNALSISKEELKYALPEQFEYIDEDYYDGLNKGIIQKNQLFVDPEVYYENVERTYSNKELLEYWFITDNLPQAKECQAFYYYLDHDEEAILNVATYLYMEGCGPLLLLLELNKNINSNMIASVNYHYHDCSEEARKEFDAAKECLLNMVEITYKASFVRKKKEL